MEMFSDFSQILLVLHNQDFVTKKENQCKVKKRTTHLFYLNNEILKLILFKGMSHTEMVIIVKY